MEELHNAIRNGIDETGVRICLEKIGEYKSNRVLDEKFDGVTALSLAIVHSNVAAAKYLILSGSSINSTSKVWDEQKRVWRFETPLVTASRLGLLPIVDALLLAGVELEIPDSSLGKTALNWACTRRHPDVAKRLIEYGADINRSDYAIETPMTEAIGNRLNEIVELLIMRGVNLNVHVNYDRDTAVLFAILINEISMAEKLIQAGANINVMNRNGEDCMASVIMSPVIMSGGSAVRLCELLIEGGYKVTMSHLNKVRTIGDGECAILLENALFNTKSLFSSARLTLRRVLMQTSNNRSIRPFVERLPLPKRLKEAINLEII